jgi:hypothetical protein
VGLLADNVYLGFSLLVCINCVVLVILPLLTAAIKHDVRGGVFPVYIPPVLHAVILLTLPVPIIISLLFGALNWLAVLPWDEHTNALIWSAPLIISVHISSIAALVVYGRLSSAILLGVKQRSSYERKSAVVIIGAIPLTWTILFCGAFLDPGRRSLSGYGGLSRAEYLSASTIGIALLSILLISLACYLCYLAMLAYRENRQ